MADLLKILNERQTQKPPASAIDSLKPAEKLNVAQQALLPEPNAPGLLPVQSEIGSTTEHEWESATPSLQTKQFQEVALATLGKRTPWGIPIADSLDATDPVFRRRPAECNCFRDGILRCAVSCIWAWPPEAKIGDKALQAGSQ